GGIAAQSLSISLLSLSLLLRPRAALQLSQQPRQLPLLGPGQARCDGGLEGAHLLPRRQELRLGRRLQIERMAAPVARQHLAAHEPSPLEPHDHRAHGRLVDAEAGGQRHLRDARIGPDQGQHAERARGQIETGKRGLEIGEDLGLRAPHLVADVGGQLVEADLPFPRLADSPAPERRARPFHCAYSFHAPTLVIPGLPALGLVPRVPGIQPSACSGACGTMDPGDKHRDDRPAELHPTAHILEGSQSARIGNAIKIIRRMMSVTMNGSTPLKMVAKLTSCTTLLITNTFMPTGGWISPSSTVMTMITPNQIGSKPRWAMTGKMMGIVRMIMAMASIRQPSTRYMIMISASTP